MAWRCSGLRILASTNISQHVVIFKKHGDFRVLNKCDTVCCLTVLVSEVHSFRDMTGAPSGVVALHWVALYELHLALGECASLGSTEATTEYLGIYEAYLDTSGEEMLTNAVFCFGGN